MLRKLAAVIALSTLAACGDDSVTGTGPGIIGIYSLRTVNGVALPFVVATNPTVELVAEQIAVNGDGTFSIGTQTRTTSDFGVQSTQIDRDGGTYLLTGSAGTFRFNSGNTPTAVFTSNTLTLSAQTSTSVYGR